MENTLRKADLHTHSTASDGTLSPSEVVARAQARGVQVLALSDHDTLRGVVEAKAAGLAAGVTVIPAVELGAEGESEVHVLGYGVDERMPRVGRVMQRMLEDRADRMPRYLARLKALGMPVTPDDLRIPVGTAFSRPLLADAMVMKGYVGSKAEAFDRYLASGRPAYIPRLNIPAAEIISALRSDGAVPVLAHPGLITWPCDRLCRELGLWLEAGLLGIETCHPSHDAAKRALWSRAASVHDILATAGSDFHMPGDTRHGEIGSQYGHWQQAEEHLAALLAMIDNGTRGNQ